MLAGRGFGKTRTGAEWTRRKKETCGRIALVAPTAADARDVMVDGESGILACAPPWDRPKYEPSKRRVTWKNGAIATLFSAEDPESLRGPQFSAAWADELCAWQYCVETWDMLQFGLRLGRNPQCCVTTTPKPIKTLKDLLANPATVTTRGSTYANRANLAEGFFRNIIARYEGSRLGRQELEAEILEDVPGALWSRSVIDETRLRDYPPLRRVAVAIDPPVTSGEQADECGIIVAGVDDLGDGYVIADRSSQGDKPSEWARRAVTAYQMFEADCIVAEVNNGGEMIGEIIRQIDTVVPVRQVRATRGKFTRAEPISALYEQRRVHHIGSFPKLEDQMCSMTPDFDADKAGYSPDRLDALVWALTELMTGHKSEPRIRRV
ncbi:terminase family protein [Methylocystis sp. JR02]|uniref:DNA-packaging protein n=1 Tax=Methylocystis sp. JR02 TaxID=3046284 RepID=UPI0024BADC46|nr:terminase family protein [Methylocystis sp. JR02]MDJ0449233.1 terminase family protein [Methylocystis sp. JR02]